MTRGALSPAQGSTWFIGLVLAASLCGNVAQAWRNQALAHELARLSVLVPRGGVQQGTRFPALSVIDRSGARTELRLGGRRTLLYLLSQECSWCEANQANFRAVAQSDGHELRVVAMSLQVDRLSDYALKSGISGELVGLAEEATTREKLGLDVTPQAIIVAQDGVVERVWTGAWLGKMGEEISQFLNTALPGVTVPEKGGSD
jgi:hypothetical protein